VEAIEDCLEPGNVLFECRAEDNQVVEVAETYFPG